MEFGTGDGDGDAVGIVGHQRSSTKIVSLALNLPV